jgi:4-amino-4-deoxy-L-arabinose transferase-like glycosyltransferase
MIRGTAYRRARFVLLAAGSVAGLFFLYFFGLTRTGLVGPDEPRYAAIGRATAVSGDWITPRLWGTPWFEKPALLYWMTAASFKAGLGAELAPRLPVALASVAFLIYFFVVLRREFGDRAAWYAATILATSAGWLAYSHVAITDLPMSAAFAAAMLRLFTGKPNTYACLAAGALLGLAVLAKGLVPLALFIPVLWFLRHRIRDLVVVLGAAAVVAGPWYVLVTLRNGTPFLDEFIWKHHFGRFLDTALQHQQPIWFYVPVLLAALFPWTPLLALLLSRRFFQDRRAQFLLAWFAWGFVFFSVSRNKLPGYLLPLLPAVAALVGIAASELRARSPIMIALLAASGGLLLGLVFPVEQALPEALLSGITHTPFQLDSNWLVAALVGGLMCAFIELAGRRDVALALLALGMVISAVAMVWRVYPELDRQLSGRAAGSMTCLPPMNRSRRYSIDYYAGRNLPDCK